MENDNNVKSIVVEKGRQDITVHDSGAISMGRDGVILYRLLMIKSGMEMEMRCGMRLTGKAPSCFTIARREFGLKGNKQKLYKSFCEMHGFEVKDIQPKGI